MILAPYGTCYATGALLRLAATGDGGATGGFTGTAHYMWVRAERPARTLRPPETGRAAASTIEPGQVLGGAWAQDFAVGLGVPDVAYAHRGDGDQRQVQFWDQTGGSVAVVRYARWWTRGAVVSYGPRDLWAEVVAAYTAWRVGGQSGLGRYRVTVGAEDGRTRTRADGRGCP